VKAATIPKSNVIATNRYAFESRTVTNSATAPAASAAVSSHATSS
jgi:hypothetical protein